jgi:hypothetical protein
MAQYPAVCANWSEKPYRSRLKTAPCSFRRKQLHTATGWCSPITGQRNAVIDVGTYDRRARRNCVRSSMVECDIAGSFGPIRRSDGPAKHIVLSLEIPFRLVVRSPWLANPTHQRTRDSVTGCGKRSWQSGAPGGSRLRRGLRAACSKAGAGNKKRYSGLHCAILRGWF